LSAIVIDNSIALSWYMADETSDLGDQVKRRISEAGAVVPRIWWYEFRNALIVNERRGRIEAAQVNDVLTEVARLPLAIDDRHNESRLIEFARRHVSSIYDAAYLELAHRHGLPLATLDRQLATAAKDASIALFAEHR